MKLTRLVIGVVALCMMHISATRAEESVNVSAVVSDQSSVIATMQEQARAFYLSLSLEQKKDFIKMAQGVIVPEEWSTKRKAFAWGLPTVGALLGLSGWLTEDEKVRFRPDNCVLGSFVILMCAGLGFNIYKIGEKCLCTPPPHLIQCLPAENNDGLMQQPS